MRDYASQGNSGIVPYMQEKTLRRCYAAITRYSEHFEILMCTRGIRIATFFHRSLDEKISWI